MNIYTSYFANLRNLPSDVYPISIARKTPKWFTGLSIKVLAPSFRLLNQYHSDGDTDRYTKDYNDEVLTFLYAPKLVQFLNVRSGGKDVVLLCYEAPDKFCHRHLVSDWLNRNGFKCQEYSSN